MIVRILISLLLLLLASCARDDSTIVVGSKNFTENVLLGELIAQQIEARTDLAVERRLNLGGTLLCHQALRSGEVDVYPEYSGTALMAILELPIQRDAEAVLKTVAESYRRDFGAEWMDPFGFNNTFAVVVQAEEASRSGVRSISDLAAVANERVIGFNFEFYERQDGYRGLIESYGLSFGEEPKTMDLGLLYRALLDGEIDVAVGSSTDGLISALNLVILEDDRGYFPPYDAAAVVRGEVLDKHPELRAALEESGWFAVGAGDAEVQLPD